MQPYRPIPRLPTAAIAVLSLLCLSVPATADVTAERALGASEPRDNWRAFTNTDFVRDLLITGDTLWAATSGGLLRWVESTDELRVFTTVDGLGDNDLRFVTAGDSISGGVWIGGTMGRLTHWRGDGAVAVFDFRDRDDNPLPLLCAAIDGEGFLWTGSEIGVSRFDIYRHGGEIKETYKAFGDIEPQTPVQGVAIIDGTAWVATQRGVARIGLDDINPNDPRRWQSWDAATSGLRDSSNAHAVASFDGRVCAATAWGIYAWDATDAPPDSDWVGINGSVSLTTRDLYVANDTLWSATNFGPYYMTDNINRSLGNTGLRARSIFAIAAGANGTVVTGAAGTGLARRGGTAWAPWSIDQTLSNTVNNALVDRDGRIWCVHSGGLDIYDPRAAAGTQWRRLPYSGPINRGIAQHPDGTVWATSIDSGAFAIDPADPEDNWIHYDATNSSLHNLHDPNNMNNNIARVPDVVIDSAGVVWFGQLSAQDGVSVAFYDHGCWGVLGTQDGFLSRNINALYPAGDFILVAFTDIGWADFEPVRSLCLGGEQRNPPRLHSIDYRNLLDGLPSENLRDVIVDRAGRFWVGTANGLAFWDPDIRLFRRQILPDGAGSLVRSLAVDPVNNLWVGTDNGAVRVGVDGRLEHFTTLNSGLAGDIVIGVHTDQQTGDVYFGTDGGLSILASAGGIVDAVDDVYAFPNPFVPGETGAVRFAAPFGSTIDIFTAAGAHVASVAPLVGWDGRNRDETLVASGVYVFVVTGSDGSTSAGKLALIRR